MLKLLKKKPEQKSVGQLMNELNLLVQRIKESPQAEKNSLVKKEASLLKEIKVQIESS